MRNRRLARVPTTVALLFLCGCFGAKSEPKVGVIVRVEASYPQGGAREVVQSVAAPIERQVNGVEKLVHLRSRSSSDGTYCLDVMFAPGMGPDLAQTLTGNRVLLALPILPEAVRQNAPTVRLK